MSGHTERAFETAIEAGLTSSSGYGTRKASAYDEAHALFADDVSGFLRDSQLAKWEGLGSLLGSKTAATVLDSLSKELELKGTLHVLRHGFKCYGKTLRMAYFRPNTAMNPEAAEKYARNRLTITRQVAFTSVMKKADGKNRRCIIDITLAVNGIPVVTAELKNPQTGQRAADAMRQYENERDERDLLFAFKKRAVVHFAVDSDEVWMTTRLRGQETDFLPFNRGNNHGAGNPPVEGNWKTAYLWDEVLQADSLLEILQRFMHLEVKEKQVKTDKGVRTVRKETMIFPRYHQLDAVRKLVAHAKARGAGRNYLIQHSAGSGKSNSIAWLAHRLASLHDEHDEKVFHSVIVVTDRRVLDQQLQATIYQFEHKTGVVEKIDEDTQQLVRALSQGTPIVITTIQKFPFISQALSTLEKKGSGVKIDTAGKRFAVIVDEAHSSQSGETATTLKGMLNKQGIEAAIAAQLSDEEDYDLSDDAKAAVLRDALQRARQPNLSFFAFTATPKFKTKALFDEPGPSGASPFHEYTMRQAIEEGFIMDVLQNYTTYRRFFGLIKQVEDDPDVPRRKAAKVLTRYLELHPVNIEQVVSVIVEHFRLSRDATAIEAREKPAPKPKAAKPKRRKRGRPRKGEARAKEPSRLERQLTMSLPQMLADLPRACDVGAKRNAKGHTTSWIGYKLHVDTADGGIPISCIMTSASTHDSQVAIPLGTLTAGRVENLYDLMDAAYDSIEIWAHCILLGHKPIIDVNPRRSVEMQEALRREKKARRTLGLFFPEERRYVERSGSERVNGRLKDEFGGRHVRVRGYDKVLAHLMFGMTVLTASQLMRLIVPPI